MRVLAPLLCAPALLAACGGGESAPTVLENEAARAEEVKELRGWERMFGAPEATLGAANQFGFRTGNYAATGGEPPYRASGTPIVMSDASAAEPNRAGFEATGTSAERIDRIAFTLAITDPADAEAAKGRFVQTIEQFLSQFGIDEEEAFQAVLNEQDADGLAGDAGVPLSIAVEKGAGEQRRIIVTFTRPAARSPGNLENQGSDNGNRA